MSGNPFKRMRMQSGGYDQSVFDNVFAQEETRYIPNEPAQPNEF